MNILEILTIGYLTIIIITLILANRRKKRDRSRDKLIEEKISELNSALSNKTMLVQDFSPMTKQAKERAQQLFRLCMFASDHSVIEFSQREKVIHARTGKSSSNDENVAVLYECKIEDQSTDTRVNLWDEKKWAIGFANGLDAIDSLAIFHFLIHKLNPQEKTINAEIIENDHSTLVEIRFWTSVSQDKEDENVLEH